MSHIHHQTSGLPTMHSQAREIDGTRSRVHRICRPETNSPLEGGSPRFQLVPTGEVSTATSSTVPAEAAAFESRSYRAHAHPKRCITGSGFGSEPKVLLVGSPILWPVPVVDNPEEPSTTEKPSQKAGDFLRGWGPASPLKSHFCPHRAKRIQSSKQNVSRRVEIAGDEIATASYASVQRPDVWIESERYNTP